MAFKVAAVGNDGKKTREYDFDDKHYFCFKVKIEGEDTIYEVSRLKDEPPPIGQEYEKKKPGGDGKLPKLQKPISNFQGGGRAGGRGAGYSPQDIAAMRRSGAQDRALKVLELLKEPPTEGSIREWTAFFEGHVDEAVKAAG